MDFIIKFNKIFNIKLEFPKRGENLRIKFSINIDGGVLRKGERR